MGTAILPSHDVLQARFRREALTITPPLKSRRNPNSDPNPNGYHSRRRKRSPVGIQSNFQDLDRNRDGDKAMVAKFPGKNLVMGQVKILKRGELLSPAVNHTNSNNNRGLGFVGEHRKPRAKSEEDLDLVLGSTDRLGPDPETVHMQIKVSELKVADGIYAGSAFVDSPPPSSLPVPGFLRQNGTATSNLRRLLRLN